MLRKGRHILIYCVFFFSFPNHFNIKKTLKDVVQQSFVSTAPLGRGIAGRLTFQFKSPDLRGQFCGKIPAKSPSSPEAGTNVKQQLVVVIIKQIGEMGLNFFR